MLCPKCETELEMDGPVLDALTFDVVADQYICPVDRWWIQVPRL